MITGPIIAEIAALVGDPARATMLSSLLDGRARAASELARAAHVTPQTASAHLGKLTGAGLLSMVRHGRHRYFRLAGPSVGDMLDGIAAVALLKRPRQPPLSGDARALAAARICYGHLAGRLSIELIDALVARDGARLGRDYWEKMGTIRDLRRAKVELHVLEDGGFFDYEDSMNKVKSFANTWGDEGKKLEEIRKSMKATEAIRSAHFPTTSLPFGYEPSIDAVSRRKVWRPTPQAEIVRSIFQSLLEEPYEEFSALSRRHGISRQLLRKILRNRAYTGGFNWKGQFVRCEPHVIPPLIDEPSFEEVQRILAVISRRLRIRWTSSKEGSSMSGGITCGSQRTNCPFQLNPPV